MSEKKTDLCAASDRRAEEIARLRARAEKAEARIETWQVRAEAYRQSADAAGIALLRAEAERDEAWRWLESLTPGGSEFHRNPIRCVEFVRERREEAHRIDLDLRARLDAERARADRYLKLLDDLIYARGQSSQYVWMTVMDAIDKVVSEEGK